jgi:hypothetical protein
MKTWFSQAYIDRLNRLHTAGVFVKAAIVDIAPGNLRYFADAQEPFVFQGQTYSPVPMQWEGMSQSSQQTLPTIAITVANVDGQIGVYLEENIVFGRMVILQLLHLDLLGTPTDVDSVRLSILACEWHWQTAVFHVGLDLGLQEILPRGLISAEEFPGVPEGLRRASIL